MIARESAAVFYTIITMMVVGNVAMICGSVAFIALAAGYGDPVLPGALMGAGLVIGVAGILIGRLVYFG